MHVNSNVGFLLGNSVHLGTLPEGVKCSFWSATHSFIFAAVMPRLKSSCDMVGLAVLCSLSAVR